MYFWERALVLQAVETTKWSQVTPRSKVTSGYKVDDPDLKQCSALSEL